MRLLAKSFSVTFGENALAIEAAAGFSLKGFGEESQEFAQIEGLSLSSLSDGQAWLSKTRGHSQLILI